LAGNNEFDGSIAAGTLCNRNESIKMGTTSATQCLPRSFLNFSGSLRFESLRITERSVHSVVSAQSVPLESLMPVAGLMPARARLMPAVRV